MKREKKWQIQSPFKISSPKIDISELLDLLLKNRGIITKEQKDAFLHPDIDKVTISSVGIDKKMLEKAIKRVMQAIEKKEQIVVFGDYDVDGITGSAILWESLQAFGARVMPYIPHRVGEGYGLSQKGIENVLSLYPDTQLIVTVDNGIVANEAVAFANEKKIDVIISDHHTVGESLPEALAIVHTTKLCGAGVGWMFVQSLAKAVDKEAPKDHLALVGLATVADLVPLTADNRTLLIHGLKELHQTSRPGLLALCEEAELSPETIDVYAIGHIIGPRLNAMGRMESAMDSLRLLCTKDRLKAKVLADKLGMTNKQRQDVTKSLVYHAIQNFQTAESEMKKLLFIAHESYEEGVIGLVAGKLVEQYYRPAIVLSIGEKVSKASARSVAGFNIIEFIRSVSDLLINAGGHPMAAGFTIGTEKIGLLQKKLEEMAEESVDTDMLTRVVKIDCELSVQYISQEVYEGIQTLAPFGMANAEPLFTSEVIVKDIKTVGQEGRHLKLRVSPPHVILGNKLTPESRKGTDSGLARMTIDAIAFGMGELGKEIRAGDTIQIAYTIDENIWRDKKSLQLKVKDIKFGEV